MLYIEYMSQIFSTVGELRNLLLVYPDSHQIRMSYPVSGREGGYREIPALNTEDETELVIVEGNFC